MGNESKKALNLATAKAGEVTVRGSPYQRERGRRGGGGLLLVGRKVVRVGKTHLKKTGGGGVPHVSHGRRPSRLLGDG